MATNQKVLDRIKGEIKRTNKILEKAKLESFGEADTRTVVMDILVNMLGWDKFRNLTAESSIGGGYADILIKKKDAKDNDFIYAVIEIKKVGLRLNENHLRQARDYARNEGIPWVVLTNGNDWHVYYLEPTKRHNKTAPEPFLVLSISINDESIKPQSKAEILYLLSEEASRKDELDQWCKKAKAVSADSLMQRLFTKEVIDKIRIGVKKETGASFTNEEIATYMLERIVKDEARPERPDLMIRHCGK
jgi:predicted type IV restriction endonuclease